MTPEQSLRAAILDAPERKTRKPKAKRAPRRAGFARRLAVRLILLGVSLAVSRAVLSTQQGQEALVGFQTALVSFIHAEMDARRAADGGDAPGADAAAPGISFVPAPGGDGAQDARPQVTIRRQGQISG